MWTNCCYNYKRLATIPKRANSGALYEVTHAGYFGYFRIGRVLPTRSSWRKPPPKLSDLRPHASP